MANDEARVVTRELWDDRLYRRDNSLARNAPGWLTQVSKLRLIDGNWKVVDAQITRDNQPLEYPAATATPTLAPSSTIRPSFTPTMRLASTPTPRPATIAANEVVRRHYEFLNARNYQAAWSLLSSRLQARLNYAAWTNGYASTRSIQVVSSDIRTTSSGLATVAVTLSATDVQGSTVVSSVHYGTWELVNTIAGWRMDSANISRLR
jgi:hypothetical protein